MDANTLRHVLYFYGPHVLGNGSGEQEVNSALLGAGTDSDPVISDSTSLHFLNFRLKSTAETGDIRGLYLRVHYAGGAGGDGARVFANVEAETDTVHGIHASINFPTAGEQCTGQANAIRATLHVPDEELGGTVAAINAEIYCDGDGSDVTNGAFIYFNAGGDATGRGALDDNAFLFNIQGLTAGAAHLFRTGLTAATINAATTAALRIKIGATTYYIPIATATA